MNKKRAARIRTRTPVLTQSRGVLLASTASEMLGLGPDQLQRFSSCQQPPSWTLGEAVMDLPRLVRHLNDRRDWATSFAALHDVEGEHLDLAAFWADYRLTRQRWDVTGLVVSLGVQRLVIDDTIPSLFAWLAGDIVRGRALLEEEGQSKAGFTWSADHQDQLGVIGLDLVDAPLTPYQQWMVRERADRAHYAGHDQRILPREKVRMFELDESRPLRDVLVVGRQVAYELAYDTGRPVGAKKVENPWLAELLTDQINDLVVWGDLASDWAGAPYPTTV